MLTEIQQQERARQRKVFIGGLCCGYGFGYVLSGPRAANENETDVASENESGGENGHRGRGNASGYADVRD